MHLYVEWSVADALVYGHRCPPKRIRFDVCTFRFKCCHVSVSERVFHDSTDGTVTMQDRIRAVLAGQGRMPSDPHVIAVDADLYELGLTSHASVNVMLALEDEFDIEFPDDALNKTTFATIASIERAVGELIAIAA